MGGEEVVLQSRTVISPDLQGKILNLYQSDIAKIFEEVKKDQEIIKSILDETPPPPGAIAATKRPACYEKVKIIADNFDKEKSAFFISNIVSEIRRKAKTA